MSQVVGAGGRPRITWVDQARGIGIFLVVLGHALRGLHSAGIISGRDEPAFRAVDSWIYSFHMPLFFLLSGLFAGRRVGRAPGPFSRELAGSIVYPYLIWSALQASMQVALGGSANGRENLAALAWIPLYPVMQFWFLYALFLIYLAYYALRRAGLGPLGVLVAFAAFWTTDWWLDLGGWLPINAMRTAGVYFALGASWGDRGTIARIGRAPSWALALVAAVGYAAVTAIVAARPGSPPHSAAGLATASFGIAASIALAGLLDRAPRLDFVRVVGSRSLEIYVAHTIASAGLRIVLVKGLSVRDVAAHVAIGTVGGVALPLLLAHLADRAGAGFLFRLPTRPGRPEGRPRAVDAASQAPAGELAN